jgi:hypothetical protein
MDVATHGDPESKLVENFSLADGRTSPFFLTHLNQGQGLVPVKLDERVGHILWVRQLIEGEEPDTEPIEVGTEDVVVPFTPIHSISLHSSPTVGDVKGFMIGIPATQVRRDDFQRRIWLRTLRVEEMDNHQPARAPWGYDITFDAGSIALELEWIDRQFPVGDDGYAPLTNVVWTWMNIGVAPNSDVLSRYALAAARRLDTAHRHFTIFSDDLNQLDPELPGPMMRQRIFQIMGEIEVFVIALSRAVDMATDINSLDGVSVPIPKSIVDAKKVLTKFRDAYEHIEDRAKGLVRSKPHQDALTIFDWTPLFTEQVITYGGRRFDLRLVPTLILEVRSVIKQGCADKARTVQNHLGFDGAPSN